MVVMAEVPGEAGYAPHHKKKIAFVFASMRRFAVELRGRGFEVRYRHYDDDDGVVSMSDAVMRAAEQASPEEIVIAAPGERRLLEEVRSWRSKLAVRVSILEDDRFICSHSEFMAFAGGRPRLRMEDFYRQMRRKTGLLMDGDKPVGGRWNFDAENRKPAAMDEAFAGPLRFKPEEEALQAIRIVRSHFAEKPGAINDFWFATCREDAEKARAFFLTSALPRFGATQDAMLKSEAFLNHAVLSLYMNVGFLDPLETCRLAEEEFKEGRAPLADVEGFIRQILGWREFVRGVYWREGAEYTRRNSLGADRPLPDYYWTGNSKMACMRASISQTLQNAYAHHIQRLMVTGNFALIAGIDPYAVHEWYLGVYADAYEWVEAPNVIGMALFADGGVFATKPYAASGAYINRMSDYCRGCDYDVKDRCGPRACPFNALYWDFLDRNAKTLRSNPRLAQSYRTFEKFDDAEKSAVKRRAATLRDDLGAL
jgi:deoxyribodipyrimidine photolyase-related protein